MAAYNFDHSFCSICSILSPAVFNQSPYPFPQGVPFSAVRLWQIDDAWNRSSGIFVTMLLSVAGALVAGFLGRGLGWYREGGPGGLFASIIGAYLRFIAWWRPATRESVPTTGLDYLDHIQVDEEWRLFDVQGFSGRFCSPRKKFRCMHFKHTSFTEGPTRKHRDVAATVTASGW